MGSAIWLSTLSMMKAIIFALWLGYLKEPSAKAKEKGEISVPNSLGLLTLEDPGSGKDSYSHWTDGETETWVSFICKELSNIK